MLHKKSRFGGAVAVAAVLCSIPLFVSTQGGGSRVAIDADDIGGVVTSAKGPEAGVWVIAETKDLPTKFVRIVVTDDQGRYVLPDMPRATYQVFVRGYGLVDSQRVTAKLGQQLNLTAVIAPDGKAAAQIFPAAYWLSLIELPKGDQERLAIDTVKNCLTCHQLGDPATRTIPASLGTFPNSLAAWDKRVQVGPSGSPMAGSYRRLGDNRKIFAEWTDKIAAGAYPKDVPPRPQGLERNLVISLWDWSSAKGGRSDAAATDERKPTLNANGPIYGAIQSDDVLAVLDPLEHRASEIKIPSTAPKIGKNNAPSPYFGDEDYWERVSDPRSVALDQLSRVWVTTRIRGDVQPAYCTAATNKFAKNFPLSRPSSRQLTLYDPKTKQFTNIDTCFSADHNHFANDADNSLLFGQQNSIGWVSTSVFDKTKNQETAQGWCPAILDTNGDGKITEWTEPNQPVDPAKDHRIEFGCYSISVGPDGAAWCTGVGPRDIKLVRIERGANPPQTCKAEVYEPPAAAQTPPMWNSGGIAIDSNGVAWVDWRGSDHFTSFDRRKCKTTSGPTATGQQCAEGWTIHRKQGPMFAGGTMKINSDMSYLTQVDHHNALGLGENVPLTGTVNMDSLLAVVPQSGQFVELRIPYPMGFFSRSGQGRIDDAKTGWKGKGFWSNYSSYTPWHEEGGKGTTPKLVKFQVRPSPLAK